MSGTNTVPGLLSQAVDMCFDSINTFPEREFLFRVSYLEVYNEQVKDLLNPEPAIIKILYDPKLGEHY
jgi:centromeric protein E